MSTLPAQVIEHLRHGDLIYRKDHPKYQHVLFWCHYWPGDKEN